MSAILETLPVSQSSEPSGMNLARPLTIAVAGNPNAGKTRLFNSLTGLRQKVANYPGVTVESKTGQWTLRPELPPARLIDLPGLYSLDATSRAGSTRLPLGEEKGERALRAQFSTLSLPQGERAPASDSASQQIQNSLAGRAGRMIEPVIAPLGFDWKIGIGLISSFAARETIISTLSIVYNVGETSDNKSSSLVGAMQNAKRPDGSPVWTPLVGISLMLFFLLACQCMSTVAIVRRETNSWRWPLLMVGYMMVLAYLASFVTYQGGRLLGFS